MVDIDPRLKTDFGWQPGVRVVETSMVPEDKAVMLNGVLHVHPSQMVWLCVLCRDYDKALDKLQKVIHGRIDSGRYFPGKVIKMEVTTEEFNSIEDWFRKH